jgi:hypothetical protein
VMLRPWYSARGREIADGPQDPRRAHPVGTARAVRQRVVRARTLARCEARAASEAAQPGVVASLGRRTGANAEGTACGRGVGAASRLDVSADPFCVADALFEHTYR